MENRTTPPTYAFKKSLHHFEKIEQTSNEFTKLKKKPKPGSSPERANNQWYEITNELTQEKHRTKVNQVIVATGELIRLLDPYQTKYRIYQDDKQEFPISQGIKGRQFYQRLYERNGTIYYEGMGRGFVAKLFVMDPDLHYKNILIDGDYYFHIIDHDRCFPAVTMPLHIKSDEKFSISQSQADYDSLPHLRGEFGKRAPFELNSSEYVSSNIARELSTHPDLLNEKHFATLKIVLTEHLQSMVLNHHDDKSDTMREVKIIHAAQIQQFMKFAKNSPAFRDYVKKHRIEALYAILHEVNHFLRTNKHYIQAFGKSVEQLLQEESAAILEKYSRMLQELGEEPLSRMEQADTQNFVNGIELREAIKTVKMFYLQQNWRLRAWRLDEKQLEGEIEVFLAEKLSATEFLSNILAYYDPCAVDPLLFFLQYLNKQHKELLPEIIDAITDEVNAADFLNELTTAQRSYLVQYLFLTHRFERAHALIHANDDIDINCCDFRTKETGLELLVQDKKPDMRVIRFLCENMQPPALLAKDRIALRSALSLAIQQGHFDIAAYFIENFSEQLTERQRNYAALLLLEVGQHALSESLTKNPLELIKFAVAEEIPCLPVLRYLCEESKTVVDFAKEDKKDNPFIMLAFESHQWDVINYLCVNEALLKRFSENQLIQLLYGLMFFEKIDKIFFLLKARPDVYHQKGKNNLMLGFYLENTQHPDFRFIAALCEDKEFPADLSQLDVDPLIEKPAILHYFLSNPDLLSRFTAYQIGKIFYKLIETDAKMAKTIFIARPDLNVNYRQNYFQKHNAINLLLTNPEPDPELVHLICEYAHPCAELKTTSASALKTVITGEKWDLLRYFIKVPYLIKQFSAEEIGEAVAMLVMKRQYVLMDSLINARRDLQPPKSDIQDDLKNTPLHIAVADEKPDLKLIQFLALGKKNVIEKYLNVLNAAGETPLRIALNKGNLAICLLLLKSADRNTPLDDINDVVQLILKQEKNLVKMVDLLGVYRKFPMTACVAFIQNLINKSESIEMIIDLIYRVIELEKSQPLFQPQSKVGKKIGLFKCQGVAMSDELLELIRFAKNKISGMLVFNPDLKHYAKVHEFMQMPTTVREKFVGVNLQIGRRLG